MVYSSNHDIILECRVDCVNSAQGFALNLLKEGGLNLDKSKL